MSSGRPCAPADTLALNVEARVLGWLRRTAAAEPACGVAEEDHAVGFAYLIDILGEAHLEELDVMPEHGRRGLGTALLEAACDWARTRGYGALSLCTYRDIPFNAPFYARHGFRALEPED